MTASALAMLILLILSEKNIFPLGWTWLLLIGTFLTFATGWMFGKKGESFSDPPPGGKSTPPFIH
jgi:hypothetical protein